ncbi:MAG: nucleotidyltransferase domain-containing protein [Candidatus Methanomethylicaceae archaeon]|nr:nucleotidyltransferase domain-containing protein [Candidatus Verstraetearchaeota archaeon]
MLSRTYIERKIKHYINNLPIEVKFAILFGSTIYNNRLKNSDIDLIIVSNDFKNMPFEKRILILQKYWKHNVTLEVFGFTEEEFEKLKSKSIIIQEAIEKGKIISCKKNKKLN